MSIAPPNLYSPIQKPVVGRAYRIVSGYSTAQFKAMSHVERLTVDAFVDYLERWERAERNNATPK